MLGTRQFDRSKRVRVDQEHCTIPAMLQQRAESNPDSPALWSLSSDGTWSAILWAEYRDAVTRIATGLRNLGLSPGDRIGILAPSSPQWDFVQIGALMARGVVVGLDPHDRDVNLQTVVERCGLVALCILEPDDLARFGPGIRERLRFVITLQPARSGGATPYEDLLAEPAIPGEAHAGPEPDEPATIIFTSGTTGSPKGIQYSHRQICLAIAAILEAFPEIGTESRVACWLPLSNLFQRIINMSAIGCGAQTYYVEDPRSIMRHVGSIAPHVFIGVPRFYEKLYAGLIDRVYSGPFWQRHLVDWALRVGALHASAVREGRRPALGWRWRYAAADRLVLRRLRGVLGSNLRILVSGSAPMPRGLLERFHAMGLLILEAYGMSENVIPIAMNRPNAYRFGSVGRTLQGNTVRVAEDGELWVQGAGVFSGYYGEAHDDGVLFDAEGYLATGDYGSVDTDGFITLTGRKSEIFKTSTGRRIAPTGIESALRDVPYVDHIMVVGANRPFPVVVLAVAAEAWLELDSANAAPVSPAVRCDRLRHDLAPGLETLVDYQRPAAAVVTTQAFSVQGGELTANLKLRRKTVETAFGDHVEELYRLLGTSGGKPWQVELDQGRVVLCSL